MSIETFIRETLSGSTFDKFQARWRSVPMKMKQNIVYRGTRIAFLHKPRLCEDQQHFDVLGVNENGRKCVVCWEMTECWKHQFIDESDKALSNIQHACDWENPLYVYIP
jgi:hypothetical protein